MLRELTDSNPTLDSTETPLQVPLHPQVLSQHPQTLSAAGVNTLTPTPLLLQRESYHIGRSTNTMAASGRVIIDPEPVSYTHLTLPTILLV